MRRSFILAAVLAALASGSAVAAGPFQNDTRNPLLSGKLSALNNSPITVFCEGRVGETGFAGGAFAGQPEYGVELSYLACRSAVRGGGVGMLVLLHEWGHTTGINGEAAANCFSLARLRSALISDWGFSKPRAQQSYRIAVTYMRTMQGPDYRCGAAK